MAWDLARRTKWLWAVLLAAGLAGVAITAGSALLPWPSTAEAGVLASGEGDDTVTAEAEGATLAGPVTVGYGSDGTGYVEFGSSALPSSFQPAAPGSFRFGVAGDLGGGSAATASLGKLAGAGTDFFLGIGDMSYDEVKPESAWCAYVQQHVGPTYPFEVLVGNHEEQPSGPNGFIDLFAACLPDRLRVQGLYAHRYYFDYPPGAPLARFILIDPDLYRGATVADYCTSGETENCGWLKARIAEAKSQGLWTIVGMHKNCLTIGQKTCEIGAGLLNELIAAKVDLVLQGHDHGYQRSKQLSLGTDCPAVKTRAYNPACVVDDGSDGSYARGAGLVFAISAAFGRSAYAVDTADPEAGYMAAWMDPAAPSNGFLEFTVTKEMIDGQFVAARGTYSDHLTIAASDVPPTPAVTPTPGGTVPPTPGGTVPPTPGGTVPPTPGSTVPPPCPAPADGVGVATLSVDFAAAGDYYIWSRMQAPDTAGGAYWLQIDDSCALRVVAAQAGDWEWVNYQDGEPDSPMQAQIKAGAHVVRFYGSDAGVRVDKLIFTTDPNLAPRLLPVGVGERVFLPLVEP